MLRAAGPTDVDDVIGRARAFIATPPSVHIPQPPTWAMRVSKPEVPLSEIEGHEQQLAAKDELIGALDEESARLTATRDVDLLRLGPDDFVRVVGAMFDAYRAGEVLEGHLPLVLDGVLDGLAADARDAAVLALAEVDDIQVIVVTDDETVTRRVRDAGGTIVQWPTSESSTPATAAGSRQYRRPPRIRPLAEGRRGPLSRTDDQRWPSRPDPGGCFRRVSRDLAIVTFALTGLRFAIGRHGHLPGGAGAVTAIPGSTTALVRWTPPTAIGGSAITSYVVTPYAGTTALAKKVVGNVTQTSIAGLTNKKAYTFRVAATNANGTGPQRATAAIVIGTPVRADRA